MNAGALRRKVAAAHAVARSLRTWIALIKNVLLAVSAVDLLLVSFGTFFPSTAARFFARLDTLRGVRASKAW